MSRFIIIFSFIFFTSVSFATAEVLTPQQLQQKYVQAKSGGEKVRVLIVPGHDNQTWGTEFRGMKEVELNRVVAAKLYELFSKDPTFVVFRTQEKENYTTEFSNYLESAWNAIKQFKNDHIAAMSAAVASGKVEKQEGAVPHNTAQEDVATTIYGVNKWANDNDIDLVIHVHFNDYSGRTWNTPGDHSGFTIYVPESQLKNAEASKAIAQKVYAQLAQFNPVSNLPGESEGVTEDQELIAIGSHNSLEAASMLIEYGYIYEPQLLSTSTRSIALNDYAYQTYLGVKDFFGVAPTKKLTSLLFPKLFSKELKKGMKENAEVYALQVALVKEGTYPGTEASLNQCSVSGNFDDCTELAVKAYQKKKKIPATGLVGPMTRKALNLSYSK